MDLNLGGIILSNLFPLNMHNEISELLPDLKRKKVQDYSKLSVIEIRPCYVLKATNKYYHALL